MSNPSNMALIEKWASHWDAHDVDGLLSIFSADGRYEDMAIGHVSNGAQSMRDFFEYTFTVFPDFGIEFQRASADDTHGFLEWIMTGTHSGEVPGRPPSHKSFRVPGVSVMLFENGLITSNRDFWNKGTFDRQAAL